jgi:hypothetical protein
MQTTRRNHRARWAIDCRFEHGNASRQSGKKSPDRLALWKAELKRIYDNASKNFNRPDAYSCESMVATTEKNAALLKLGDRAVLAKDVVQ